MTITRRPALLAAVLLFTAVLGLTACSGSSSSGSQAKVKGVIVKDAWARTSPMSTGAGAAYLTIENTAGTTEKLMSVSVPASVAASAQIHETVMVDGSGTTMAGAGMMAMREVESVPIPAGGTVKLEPGGYHIMLLDLASPLKNGQKFTMNLGFLNAGVVQIEVTVKDS